MGKMHAASDRDLKRPVALKMERASGQVGDSLAWGVE